MSVFRRLHRRLDPVVTLGELIFGLIMVLTFTLGARLLGPDEPTDGRELLIAAIGCNLAWGIIDGFLYALGEVYERRRVATVMELVRSAPGEEPAVAVLEAEAGGELAGLADPAERKRFCASVARGARQAASPGATVTEADVRGAIVVFLLVFATALPAALPFLVLDDAYVALRTSNALLIGLLFVVGALWGRHVGARPWLAGALVMTIGIMLVLIAIPLGG
jgi:hypothetical protein